jgi:hypothetical protein
VLYTIADRYGGKWMKKRGMSNRVLGIVVVTVDVTTV